MECLNAQESLRCTRSITPKRVTSGGPHFRGLAHSARTTQLRKTSGTVITLVAVIESRWRCCARFDRASNRTHDLPL